MEAPDAEIQLVDSQAQTSGVGGMFPQKSFKIGLSETQFSEFPGDQNWLTLKILKALKITTKNENIINLAIIIELPDITCQTTWCSVQRLASNKTPDPLELFPLTIS